MAQPQMIRDSVVEARGVTRDFRSSGVTARALRGVDMRLSAGEFVALRGRSGAGKTTLLNILIGLDNPTSGGVRLFDHDLATLNETARARLRRERVGILFQHAHLFPLLTAQENVEMALRLTHTPATERRERAGRALERVGLAARTHHRGLELSGGEQQRVALARALAHAPSLLVADEPTGALDVRTGRDIIALLREIARVQGITLLVATHDAAIVAEASREIEIADGLLVERSPV